MMIEKFFQADKTKLLAIYTQVQKEGTVFPKVTIDKCELVVENGAMVSIDKTSVYDGKDSLYIGLTTEESKTLCGLAGLGDRFLFYTWNEWQDVLKAYGPSWTIAARKSVEVYHATRTLRHFTEQID